MSQRLALSPALHLQGVLRERETRPLSVSDRHRLTKASTKSRQLNLKVTPEFHDRVSALARNEGVAMVELVARAVEAYARSKDNS